MFAYKNTREEIETKVSNVTKFPLNGDDIPDEEKKALKDLARLWIDANKYKAAILAIGGLIAAAITFGFQCWEKSINVRFDAMDAKLDQMNDNIVQFKEDVSDDLNEMKVSIDNLDARVSRLETDVAMIKGDLYGVQKCQAEDDFVPKLISLNMAVDQAPLSDDTLVAIDEKTGETFTVDDLTGKKLLLSYTVDDCENVFYGQFNEKNRWDGHCVINSYRNGKLWFTTETEYDGGSIQYYRQAFISDDNAVVVSTRVHNVDGSNTGVSQIYECVDSIQMAFALDDVIVSNLVGTTQAIEECAGKLVSYYSGDTKDGVYEDSTGAAYLAKYDNLGKLSMLYRGSFKNGTMQDVTGNAWYLIWNGSAYEYYQGTFKDGHKQGTVQLVETKEQLVDYSLGQGFNCPLNWHDVQ